MADEDPPKLTIASTRSEADLKRDREEKKLARDIRRIEGHTRELATNMIRIIRGAGRPIDLFDQVIGLCRTIEETPDQTTVGQINGAMEAALGDGLERDDERELRDAVYSIEAATLRKVAARIIRQPVQFTAGDHDFWEGVRRLERAREELRASWQAELAKRDAKRAQQSFLSRRNKRPTKAKPKAKPKPTTPKQLLPSSPTEQGMPASTAEFMRARQRELREEE